MTFFRENQRKIAYWLIGTAFIIFFELSLGVYLNTKGTWINFNWIQSVIGCLMVIGWVIEMERLKFFNLFTSPQTH
jgi:hypothetical protein